MTSSARRDEEREESETQLSKQNGARTCDNGYSMNRLSASHHPVSNTR